MSDAIKVEEPVVAVAGAPVVEPVVEAAPAEVATEVAADAPAAEEAAAATEEAPAVDAEVKPVEEGVLGYKGPGLLKYVPPFFDSSRFFIEQCILLARMCSLECRIRVIRWNQTISVLTLTICDNS